jgi:hypothetical protein
MDAGRFDSLARSLTAARSRRGTLVAALGGAVGLLGLVHPQEAAARKKKKKPCPPCRKRKKGKCKPQPAGTPCTAFAGGACQNGACVNLQGDEANCGALGATCAPTHVCQAGACFPVSTCPGNATARCLGSGAFTASCNAPGAPDLCVCSRSAEGNVVCTAQPPGDCADLTPCTSSASCPAGKACVEVGSCCPSTGGTPVLTCFARCLDPAA